MKELEVLRSVTRTGDVIEFKDEGETPEASTSRLVVRSSVSPSFQMVAG